MKNLKKSLFLLFVFFIVISCNDNNDNMNYVFKIDANDFPFVSEQSDWEINTQKIPGDWELIAKGHSLDEMVSESPSCYYLFGVDNTIQIYDYKKNIFYNDNFYRADSLFHIFYEGSDKDLFSYKYAFNENQMLFELVYYSRKYITEPELFYLYQQKK